MSPYPSTKSQFALLSGAQKKTIKKIPHMEDIEGWILLCEAVELFDLTNRISSINPIICEIGSWKGKSAYIFASALRNKGGVLFAVDPFTGEGDGASEKTYKADINKLNVSLKKDFIQTMNKYSLMGCIKILPFRSEEARNKFNCDKIDLLFIDGNHEYEFVKKDYDLWSPLVVSGGSIVLHDVKAKHVTWPKLIFQEHIVKNSMWKNVRIVGEMAVAEKR